MIINDLEMAESNSINCNRENNVLIQNKGFLSWPSTYVKYLGIGVDEYESMNSHKTSYRILSCIITASFPYWEVITLFAQKTNIMSTSRHYTLRMIQTN